MKRYSALAVAQEGLRVTAAPMGGAALILGDLDAGGQPRFCHPKRHRFSAKSYRHIRSDAFDIWADYPKALTA